MLMLAAVVVAETAGTAAGVGRCCWRAAKEDCCCCWGRGWSLRWGLAAALLRGQAPARAGAPSCAKLASFLLLPAYCSECSPAFQWQGDTQHTMSQQRRILLW